MGAWSAEPFGNDSAADWAWELDEAADWSVVGEALAGPFDDYVDSDDAVTAIAAAEVVAHGLGRPTQDDAYTERVTAFVARVGSPPDDLRVVALAALEAVTGDESELTELWEESDPGEWRTANAKLAAALRG